MDSTSPAPTISTIRTAPPARKNYVWRTIIYIVVLLIIFSLVAIFLYYFFVINPMGIANF